MTAIDYRTFKARIEDDIDDASARWVFRGQSQVQWKLESSYRRHCRKFNRDFDVAECVALAETFIGNASDFFGEDLSQLSSAEKIALAQHYGVPSVFLDWTRSPYIAVFFALVDRLRCPSDADFRVWALSTENLRREGTRPMFDSKDIGLVETRVFKTRRLKRQNGCFIHIPFDSDLENYVRSQAGRVILKGYTIEGLKWHKIYRELSQMGINCANMFDTLDGVAIDTIAGSIIDW